MPLVASFRPSYTSSRQCSSRSGRGRAAPGQKIGPVMLAISPDGDRQGTQPPGRGTLQSKTSSSRTSGRSCSGRPASGRYKSAAIATCTSCGGLAFAESSRRTYEQVCPIGLPRVVLRDFPLFTWRPGIIPADSALGDRVRGATGIDLEGNLLLRRIGPRQPRGSGLHRQPVFGGGEHTTGSSASTAYRVCRLPSQGNAGLRQTVRGRRDRSQPKQ